MDERHYLRDELYDLVKSDERVFDFLQSGSLDGMWYWDILAPEHEWMSPGFWELLGYDPARKKHLASEWQDLIHPDDLKVALENFEKHCADPEHPYDQVVRYKHRDGSTVWVRCRGLAIRDESGKPTRLLGAHTDITALKQVEEQLREALEANRELEQFAYIAAHDLREPLRTIGAHLDLLRATEGHVLSGEANQRLGTAIEASYRMQRLLAAIGEYATGNQPGLVRKTVGAATLLQRALDDLATLIGETGAEVTHTPLPSIEVDEAQLGIVFQNLVANAIEHRGDKPGPPRIHVGAQHAPGGTILHVDDDGPGIPEAEQDRIFQMFQRLNPTDSGALGVGLTNARRIVEGHGGTLWVTASPMGGARFSFAIPRIVSKKASKQSSAPMTGWAAVEERAHVVMVDDSEPEIDLAYECFRRSKAANPWRSFNSGTAFLSFLERVAAGEETMPALVLLDLNMPGPSGLDVLAKTRADPRFKVAPPVVILTNSINVRDRERATELGAIGLKVKPDSVADYVAFFDAVGTTLLS